MPEPISGKVGLDVTEFKAGISELNRQLRVVESGFRATAAGMGEWDKTSAGLEARMKALNDEMEIQQRKVTAIRDAYQKLAAEKGETSRAAQDMLIRLNKETETLNKMQSELNQSKTALDGMGDEAKTTGDKVDDLGDKEEKATGKTNIFKAAVNGLGGALKTAGKMVAGVAAGAVAVGAGVTALVLKTAKSSDELVEMSDKTGISVERLQEMAYIADQTGTDLDTMTGSMARLVRSMAADATTDQAKALGSLGINVRDANGNLRDSKVVWSEALAALGGISNETERDALAMTIFGKSAQELNPLIKAGKENLDDMAQAARDTGAVIGEDNVRAFADFNDVLGGLKMGLTGTLGTLAGAFLPGFKTLAGKAGGYLTQFSGVVKGSNGDLGKMAEGIGGIIGQIASDIAADAPRLLQAGLGILQGIINAIVTNLPLLLPAVIQMISSLLQFIVQNMPLLINAGVQVLLTLVNGLITQLPMLITAGVQILVALANGIAGALPQLIPAIVKIIPQVVTTLIQNLPLLITAALQIIMALAQGLITSLPTLIAALPEIITTMVTTLISLAPQLLESALTLITTLVTGLVENLPKIGEAAGKIIQTVVDGIGKLGNKLLEVGKSIVEGVWNGISGAWDWFWGQVNGFFSGIIDGVKKALGIASPSKVFGGIGKNMALGLGEGFVGSFEQIQRNVNRAIGQLGNGQMGMTISNAAQVAAGRQAAQSSKGLFDGATINLNNGMDIEEFKAMLVEVLR